MSGFEAEILSGRTWGDGIHLVFGDICAAATCSLALQVAVNEIDFSAMVCRICAG